MQSVELYGYVKVFHIVSLICWLAALFYLPRLFVYHSENATNEAFTKVAKVQESRLMLTIGYPAMVTTLLSGATLIMLNPAVFTSGIWLHIKLTLVILLVIYHFVCDFYRKQFARDAHPHSAKFFRIFNEIPTILLIAIVACAVLQF